MTVWLVRVTNDESWAEPQPPETDAEPMLEIDGGFTGYVVAQSEADAIWWAKIQVLDRLLQKS